MIALYTPSEAAEEVIQRLTAPLGTVKGDIESAALYEAVRRAAAVRSPCTRDELVDAVAGGFERLGTAKLGDRNIVATAFDQLVASGDLLVSSFLGGRGVVQLAPPTFIPRTNGRINVIGGLPDIGLPVLLEGWRLVTAGRRRFIMPTAGVDLRASLVEAGYHEMPLDVWMESPSPLNAADLVRKLERGLDDAPPAGEADRLEILDPLADPRYYRGRWVSPGRRSGRYVARMPARYGGRYWLYVELRGGETTRAINLPCVDGRFRASDEAWWIQSAKDHLSGKPQCFSVSRGLHSATISAFSPLPMWAERRLEVAGKRVKSSKGALLSYAIDVSHVADVVQFLTGRMWLKQTDAGEISDHSDA